MDMFPTYLCFVVYFQSSILPHFFKLLQCPQENSSNKSGEYLQNDYRNLVGNQGKTYFSRWETTNKRINTNITLAWAYKQFATTVHISFFLYEMMSS